MSTMTENEKKADYICGFLTQVCISALTTELMQTRNGYCAVTAVTAADGLVRDFIAALKDKPSPTTMITRNKQMMNWLHDKYADLYKLGPNFRNIWVSVADTLCAARELQGIK